MWEILCLCVLSTGQSHVGTDKAGRSISHVLNWFQIILLNFKNTTDNDYKIIVLRNGV